MPLNLKIGARSNKDIHYVKKMMEYLFPAFSVKRKSIHGASLYYSVEKRRNFYELLSKCHFCSYDLRKIFAISSANILIQTLDDVVKLQI